MEIKNKTIFILSLLLPIVSLLIGKDIKQLGFPVSFVFYGPDSQLKYAYEVFEWRNMVRCSWRLDLYAINVLLIYSTLIFIRQVFRKNKMQNSHKLNNNK